MSKIPKLVQLFTVPNTAPQLYTATLIDSKLSLSWTDFQGNKHFQSSLATWRFELSSYTPASILV
jgi:hypothetical protein